MRDRVEVALQVRIHHMAEALLQQPVHLPQPILAAPPRPEAVATGPELGLEDRLDHHLHRPLHTPVLPRPEPKRAGLALLLRDLDPLDRSRTVAAIPQARL